MTETEEDTLFVVTCEQEGNSDTILKLAISYTLNNDKYSILLGNNESIYQISVRKPLPYFLKTKKLLEIFRYEYSELLNAVQTKHGVNYKIVILLSVPISIAIECGRVILPTKDHEIYVC